MRVHDTLRERARLRGAAQWVDELPELLDDVTAAWALRLGEPFETGTEAYVVPATMADGTAAVLKVLLPWPGGPANHESAVLRLAGGHGLVRLLRHDDDRGALLLEALGQPLDQAGLPTEARLEIMCDTLAELWDRAGELRNEVASLGLTTGAEKAAWLAEYVHAQWEALGRPCGRAAVDHALACAERRRRAHDDGRSMLVHGDVHQWNTLRHPDGGHRLVDPDGLFAEPEYDLGVILREDADEPDDPMRGDPRARARWLAERTGLSADAVWEWGVVERVSSGLLAVAIGLQPFGDRMLALADRIAE